MSRDNVDIVQRGYAHVARTGQPDLSTYHPDVVVDTTTSAFDGAVYHGHTGLLQWWSLGRDMWKQQRFEPDELIPVGDNHVVVAMRMVSVGRGDVETVARGAVLFVLRDGRVTHMKTFQTKDDALAAAQLPE